jgi:hypothetical protein
LLQLSRQWKVEEIRQQSECVFTKRTSAGKLARAQKERQTERMSWRASASFANLRLTAEIEKILGKIFYEERLE